MTDSHQQSKEHDVPPLGPTTVQDGLPKPHDVLLAAPLLTKVVFTPQQRIALELCKQEWMDKVKLHDPTFSKKNCPQLNLWKKFRSKDLLKHEAFQGEEPKQLEKV